MKYLPISKIPLVEEENATGEVAETYNKIRSFMGTPAVSPADMARANSPVVLALVFNMVETFMQQTILPPPLLFMIHYTISTTKKCACCSAGFKSACRSVGIDEMMLEALVNDLDSVTPRRTQEIIRFAVKCALEPLTLTEADYNRVRDYGISEQELVEIIFWASIAMAGDTFADAAKLDDPERQQIIED